MKCHVFKRKRRKNGKLHVSPVYSGRYRLAGDVKDTEIALETTDKQVAETNLRLIVNEKERERAGMLAPRNLREAMRRPIVEHMEEFTRELRVNRKVSRYVDGVHTHLATLIKDCRWKTLGDVTAETFCAWRRGQTNSAKTLNEYLSSALHFLNWLEKDEKVSRNPLRSVDKIKGHIPTFERRSLTLEQSKKLIEVSGPRAPLYLVVMTAGLRRNELLELEWRDVRLDAECPFLALRAATTKNGKEAHQPLHPDAAEALRNMRPIDVSPKAKVFPRMVPRMPRVRKDLAEAGIPFVDAEGKRMDLHALRHTFQMLLTLNGSLPRVTMELMRHSDMKLTTKTYTDAGKLPTAATVNALPSLLKNSKQGTPQGTPVSTLLPVSGRHGMSRSGTPNENQDEPGLLINTGFGRDASRIVTASHESGNGARCRVRTCDFLRVKQALYH